MPVRLRGIPDKDASYDRLRLHERSPGRRRLVAVQTAIRAEPDHSVLVNFQELNVGRVDGHKRQPLGVIVAIGMPHDDPGRHRVQPDIAMRVLGRSKEPTRRMDLAELGIEPDPTGCQFENATLHWRRGQDSAADGSEVHLTVAEPRRTRGCTAGIVNAAYAGN